MMIPYFIVLFILAMYGLHRYVLLYDYFAYRKNVPGPPQPVANWPKVTIQLPIFNERYVIERLVDAVSQFDYPKDFTLRDYVHTRRELDFLTDAPVRLELACDEQTGNRLRESPMATDQDIASMPDGRSMVSGTVMPSLKLRWWLRSLGTGVEVMAPADLRAEFAEEYRQLAQRYGG